MNRTLRTTALTLLAAAATAALVLYLVRDQMRRHRRDLFSPRALRRLAALGVMSLRVASVDDILLLRDFIANEPRPLLRARARAILERMEREVLGATGSSLERAG